MMRGRTSAFVSILASSATRCRFVDRFVRLNVLSRVSRQRFSPHGTPLSSIGSRSVRFPDVTGTIEVLRLPATHIRSLICRISYLISRTVSEDALYNAPAMTAHVRRTMSDRSSADFLNLFASLPGSTRSSSLRVSQLALPVGSEGTFRARAIVQPATQTAGALARGRERDLPGSQTIHPVLLPRSATPAEPTIPRLFDGLVDAAPALPTARASALNEFRDSITRLWHLLPTLQDWCCHHPCKARFRLAGSPLPGGSRTLRI